MHSYASVQRFKPAPPSFPACALSQPHVSPSKHGCHDQESNVQALPVECSMETGQSFSIPLPTFTASHDPDIPQMAIPLLAKLGLMGLYSMVSALWAYFVVKNKAEPGWQRTLAALPFLALNLALPLALDYTSEPLFITPVAGCFSLAAFKVGQSFRAWRVSHPCAASQP